MPIAIRTTTDQQPGLEPILGLRVRRVCDPVLMAGLQSRSPGEMRRRFEEGHRAHVAELDGVAAAWGWVATRQAAIGELAAAFTIPAGERYLWNFVTRPAFRGLGIYPRLLDAIVRAESPEAGRFWIAWAPENHASGAGIRKAGFTAAAELSFDAAGRAAVHALRPGGDMEAARLIGLPSDPQPLAQCWRCVRAGRLAMSCAPGACRCDYQVAASGCTHAA